ncbi:MAG: formylglycine-generating enzyme family protein [Bacteroidales bacterium]
MKFKPLFYTNIIILSTIGLIINSCKKDDKIVNNQLPIINIEMVSIPANTFSMGSPITEDGRRTDETQHQVTLSSYKISKYEITNAQFAFFLNILKIDSNGIYADGINNAQKLIFQSSSIYDWGLHYTGGQWLPVKDYENYPVINVTWFGAAAFASYAGGRLPTEAEWECACRATTTSIFNTGNCLCNSQSNYDWEYPLSSCNNTINIKPGKTLSVSSYSANAFGLYNMHGNVFEWCSDWYSGDYTNSPQTNPIGSSTGVFRVFRGGSWETSASNCRSAYRSGSQPVNGTEIIGFRIVKQ